MNCPPQDSRACRLPRLHNAAHRGTSEKCRRIWLVSFLLLSACFAPVGTKRGLMPPAHQEDGLLSGHCLRKQYSILAGCHANGNIREALVTRIFKPDGFAGRFQEPKSNNQLRNSEHLGPCLAFWRPRRSWAEKESMRCNRTGLSSKAKARQRPC